MSKTSQQEYRDKCSMTFLTEMFKEVITNKEVKLFLLVINAPPFHEINRKTIILSYMNVSAFHTFYCYFKIFVTADIYYTKIDIKHLLYLPYVHLVDL